MIQNKTGSPFLAKCLLTDCWKSLIFCCCKHQNLAKQRAVPRRWQKVRHLFRCSCGFYGTLEHFSHLLDKNILGPTKKRDRMRYRQSESKWHSEIEKRWQTPRMLMLLLQATTQCNSETNKYTQEQLHRSRSTENLYTYICVCLCVCIYVGERGLIKQLRDEKSTKPRGILVEARRLRPSHHNFSRKM